MQYYLLFDKENHKMFDLYLKDVILLSNKFVYKNRINDLKLLKNGLILK